MTSQTDTRTASLFRELPADFRIVDTICQSKVRFSATRSLPNTCQITSDFIRFSTQVVLRSDGTSPYASAGRHQRHRHGDRVLPRPHRSDASVLGKGVRYLRHAGFREAGSRSSGGLDRLLHLSGHLKHNLDVQNRPRLLQGHQRQAEGGHDRLQKVQ